MNYIQENTTGNYMTESDRTPRGDTSCPFCDSGWREVDETTAADYIENGNLTPEEKMKAIEKYRKTGTIPCRKCDGTGEEKL